MSFVDEAEIEVVAGHGGRGIVSFRRESKVPFGGPDGGAGGRGAHIIIEATTRTVTLMDHRYRRWYKGDNGDPGGPKNCTGRSATDLKIPVPEGTVIRDAATLEVLADLTKAGESVIVAQGGRGGRGNSSFASSTKRAPEHAQPGEPGVERRLHLSLKLVADVGLLGLPNAGKSTFIRAATRSKAKVGAYPFTTKVPNLGVAQINEKEFVIADIPGLVEGASQGAGLGDRFLKHVDRTRVLIHLLSLGNDTLDPMTAFKTINAELKSHSEILARRPQVVVLNKVDLLDDRYEIELWRDAFAAEGVECLCASGLSGEGVMEVLRLAFELLEVDGATEDDEDEWSPV
jgi:GTP-binding protein